MTRSRRSGQWPLAVARGVGAAVGPGIQIGAVGGQVICSLAVALRGTHSNIAFRKKIDERSAITHRLSGGAVTYTDRRGRDGDRPRHPHLTRSNRDRASPTTGRHRAARSIAAVSWNDVWPRRWRWGELNTADGAVHRTVGDQGWGTRPPIESMGAVSHYHSVFRPDLFAGQTAVVTGGGSGIGRCTAHELASLGAHVCLVGRTPEKLLAVAAEIESDGGSASTHAADVRDEARVREVVSAVLAERGRIDHLVNNAGGQFRAPLVDINAKGFDAVVRNNLTGGFLVMREVYTAWMREHGGAVVNMVADMWGGWPMYGHSGAARSGMWNLTQTAAAEWGEAGVRVNAVAPGSIASSGLDTYDAKDDTYMLRDVSQEIPLQRWGTESEVSAAIVFLLSPAAAFVTGACLRIDGGAPNGARNWVTAPPARNPTPYQGFHRSIGAGILRRGEGEAP